MSSHLASRLTKGLSHSSLTYIDVFSKDFLHSSSQGTTFLALSDSQVDLTRWRLCAELAICRCDDHDHALVLLPDAHLECNIFRIRERQQIHENGSGEGLQHTCIQVHVLAIARSARSLITMFCSLSLMWAPHPRPFMHEPLSYDTYVYSQIIHLIMRAGTSASWDECKTSLALLQVLAAASHTASQECLIGVSWSTM